MPSVSAEQAPAGAGGTPRSPLGVGTRGFTSPRLSSGSDGASETHGLGGTGMLGLRTEGRQGEVAGGGGRRRWQGQQTDLCPPTGMAACCSWTRWHPLGEPPSSWTSRVRAPVPSQAPRGQGGSRLSQGGRAVGSALPLAFWASGTGPAAARKPLLLGGPPAAPGCPPEQPRHTQDLQHGPACAAHPLPAAGLGGLSVSPLGAPGP